MGRRTELARRPCGCLVSITVGTDGETLLSPCAAHQEVGVERARRFFAAFARHVPNGPIVGEIQRMLEVCTDEQLTRAFAAAERASRSEGGRVTPPEASGPAVWDDEEGHDGP